MTAFSTDLGEPLDGQRVVVSGRVDGAVSVVLSGLGPRVLWYLDDGPGVCPVAVPVGFPSGIALGWADGRDVIALGRVVDQTVVADRVWALDEVEAMGPRAFGQLITAEQPVVPETAWR